MVAKGGKTLYLVLDGEPISLYDTTNVNSSTIKMNGIDLEIINATAGGDIDVSTTTNIELTLGGSQNYSFNTDGSLVRLGKYFRLYDSTMGKYTELLQTSDDFSITNPTNSGDILLTASGTTADIILDSTRLVELDGGTGVSLAIAGTDEATITAGHILVKSTTPLEFGATTRYITDAGNDIDIVNTTASGDIRLNTVTQIDLQIGSNTRLAINNADVTLPSTIPLLFGSSSRSIVDSGTDIHVGLAANDMLGPAVTSTNDFGDATHVWQTGFFEAVNFYDTTGAENASITRNLTNFLFNSGTGGTYIFQVAGSPKVAIDASYIHLDTGVTQEVTRVSDADYAVLVSDWYIAVHTLAAADRTVTIPTAQNVTGRVLQVKLEGAAAGQKITIDPTTGNIEGAATLDITNDNEAVSIIYDGAQWQVF